MKLTKQVFLSGQKLTPDNEWSPVSQKSLMRKLIVTSLAVTLATAPVVGALADDGFMVMQMEFNLDKKPGFRQLNLAYQEGFGTSQWFYPGEAAKPGIVIPLYSMNPRTPGLFNSLDSPESEEDDEPKPGIGAVLGALLGLGLLAAYAYATGKCIKDTFDYDYYGDSSSGSDACEAASSFGGF